MKHQIVTAELNSSPRHAGQLALQLHSAGNEGLEIRLPEGWAGPDDEVGQGYICSAGKLIFNSVADRNQTLAQYLDTTYFRNASIEPDVLFSLARNLWSQEIGHSDAVSGRLLAEVSKHSDVLLLAAKHIAEGGKCFELIHTIDSMLVHVQDLEIGSLLNLARAWHEGTKGDLAAGMLYSSLEKWLAARPQWAHALCERLLNTTDEYVVDLLGVAFIGLSISSPDEAVSLFISTFEFEQGPGKHIGFWICGRLLQQTNISVPDRTRLEQIVLNGFTEQDGEARRKAIRAAANAMHMSGAFDYALSEIAKKGEQETLAVIANTLFMKSSELQEQERFFSWLPLLIDFSPGSQNSIEGLDHILSNILKNDPAHRPEVIDFLTAWTLKHSGNTPIEKAFAEHFHECMYKLAGHPDILASLITEWLSHEEQQLAGATAGMLYEFNISRFHNVHFDAQKLSSMSTAELLFLGRRVLGFVHDPQHLLSISLSMLSVDPEVQNKTIPILRWLIVDEIGYDYPGTTIEALVTAIASEEQEEIKLALDEWRQIIESSQITLKELPRLNELRPPSQLQRLFVTARSKQMGRAREDASKESILRKIVTEIPLKAGRGCFRYIHGEYREPSTLSSFSYEMELPRREILDPVGNAIRGFNLRTSKKNSK